MQTQTRSETVAKVFVATAVIFFMATVGGFAAISGVALVKKQMKPKIAPITFMCGIGLLTADYIVTPTPLTPFQYTLPSLALDEAQIYGDRDGDGTIKICLHGGSVNSGVMTYTETGPTIELDLAPWTTTYGTGSEPVLIYSDVGSEFTHWENPSTSLLHPYDTSAAPTSSRPLTIRRIGFSSGPLVIGAITTSVNLVLDSVVMNGLSSVSQEVVGVLVDYSSQLTVRNSTFSHLLGRAFALGGQAQATFENNTFEFNEANNGAAVRLAGSAQLTDVGSLYRENVATTLPYGDGGGAIYLFEDADYSGQGVTFLANTTQQAGGAIYANGQEMTLDLAGATFQNNQAITGGGGAVYYFSYGGSSPSVAIQDSSFVQNSAPAGSGGAVGIMGDTTVRVARTSFTENQAIVGGAVLVVDGPMVEMQSVDFRSNEAQHGGALYAVNTTIDVQEGLFEKNKAGQEGGGVFTLDGAILSFNRTTFAQNEAKMNGGAVAINGSDTSASFETTQFNNNLGGTGWYGGHGGAVACVDSAGTSSVSVDGTLFQNNDVNGFGGGISMNGCQASVENGSVFTSNHAGNAGGAIWGSSFGLAPENIVLTVEDTVFKDNAAVFEGGAIRIASITQHLSDTSFESNGSQEGGALMALASLSDLTDVSFVNNTAHGSHGAFQFDWMGEGYTNTVLNGVQAFGNDAMVGGVGMVMGGTFTGTALDIRNNTSDFAPAGISLQAAGGSLSNAVFARNEVVNYHPTIVSALNVDPIFVTIQVDHVTLADNQGTIAAITGSDSSFSHLIASHNDALQMQGYASSTMDHTLLWAVPPGVSMNGAWDLFQNGTGNLDAEPLYVGDGVTSDPTASTDILNFDFHLQPASPGVDIDPNEFDVDGSSADAGAYGGPGGNW